MSIWLTGDIHGDPMGRLSNSCFPEVKDIELFPKDKSSTVIILGDFGCIWDFKGENKEEKYKLDWLNERPFTTVFIDGNHDNHIRLSEYPIKEWNGGKVHAIRPNVLHLIRGEVYDIDGYKFFAFGGASSHDIKDGILDPNNEDDVKLIKEWRYDYTKLFRILNVSWWKEELPSEDEMKNGINNLNKNNWKVDYVLTHSPTTSMLYLLGSVGLYQPDILSNYLEDIKAKLNYKKWFFGHMHLNKAINVSDIGLYEQIIRIG